MPEETVSAAPASESTSTSSSSASPSTHSSNVYNHRIGESTASSSHTDARASEPANGAQNGEKPKLKELSRYERTKRQKAVLAQREAALRQKEAEFAQRERAQAEAAKPKRDYSLAELQKYRQSWEAEGRLDLVEAADKEIAAIKAEEEAAKQASNRTVQLPLAGTPEHKAQWEAAERELYQADPEFMRAGTRLDTRLREVMASEDGDIYRQHPRGIIAAYHRAKMELLEADLKVAQTENSKLKDELRRYQGLTSIGGGAPARAGTGGRVENLNDFAKLSAKDMRAHLLRGTQKGSTPWF